MKTLLNPIVLISLAVLIFLLGLSAYGAGVLLAEQVADYNVEVQP